MGRKAGLGFKHQFKTWLIRPSGSLTTRGVLAVANLEGVLPFSTMYVGSSGLTGKAMTPFVASSKSIHPTDQMSRAVEGE